MAQVIHETQLYRVELIPEDARALVAATNGRQYTTNYAVISNTYGVTEATYEDLLNALSCCEYMTAQILSRAYMKHGKAPAGVDGLLSALQAAGNVSVVSLEDYVNSVAEDEDEPKLN